MSLLPANYWDTPTSTPATPSPTPQPEPSPETPPAYPSPSSSPIQPALNLFGQENNSSSGTPASSSASTPATAPQSNSPGLFSYSIPNALGFGLPDPQTFENMSAGQKAEAYGVGALNATKKLAMGLVTQIPVGIASIAATGVQAAKGIYAGAKESIKQGKLVSPDQALSEENPGNKDTSFNLPLVGAAPSWFKTYDDATAAGASPLAASLLMGGTAIGDATILGGISESLGNLARPKASVTGAPVTNLEPVKTAITSDTGKVKFSPKTDSVNEYYDTTPAVAKQYGGNPGNIKVKLSPVGDGTMQASIIKLGSKGTTPSDFNGLNETKLFSQNVPMAQGAQQAVTPTSGIVPLTPEEAAARGIPIPPNSDPNLIAKNLMNEQGNGGMGDKITQKYNFTQTTMKSSDIGGGKLSAGDNESVAYWQDKIQNGDRTPVVVVRDANGSDVIDGMHKLQAYRNLGIDDVPTLVGDAKNAPAYEEAPQIGQSNEVQIPNKVAKGTEKFPVTQDQMNTLDTISKVNGLGDNVKLGVINALTGKTAVGDLTNAEFVKVATQLGKLDKSVEYSPTLGMNNLIQDWLGRRDSYFNSVEERTGIPTGQMYNRIENASRLTKIATETNDAMLHDTWGKYWTDPQAGDLVRSYRTGNEAAITDNPTLDPQTKSDLIAIAGKMDGIYKNMGVQYGIPEEKFLQNYSSNIRDTGGAVTQYADPEQFPTGSNFFAKYKRTGGLSPILTDERAIAGIYNHAGAKASFMPDALAFAKDVYDQADPQYKPAIKAYADAMAGNADAVERTLNNVGTTINQRLGWNLPPDATRKLVQLTMDTTYAASMGANPATYLRQLLSNPTYVYAENGAAGLPEAIMQYLKDPKSATEELQDRGFRVRTADPYGSAIAQEDTTFGKLGTQYRRLTSASMAPMNVVDSFGRYIMMKSSDFQFNNAIDLYNEGKMTWPQVETALDFDGMSPVDRNAIRQSLVEGDRQGAMDHLARVKIDDTQGTYRPNTLGRMMNGALGKPAFQFSAFADNYINMVGKWAKYGQWDKVVRFIGTQSIMYRTMLHQFGLDYSSDIGVNPAVPSVSPLVKTSADVYNLVQAMKNSSQADINTNKQAIVQQLQTLGFPGVEPARVATFLKSYNAGPNAQGMYQVQSGNGKLNYRSSFNDLFWNMFGFPTAGKATTENLATDEVNASTNYTTNKNQILQLIGNGQTSQATSLMKSTGVIPTASEINSYMQAQNIPLTMRLWQQLPKQLQAEFAPRVFNSATSTP